MKDLNNIILFYINNNKKIYCTIMKYSIDHSKRYSSTSSVINNLEINYDYSNVFFIFTKVRKTHRSVSHKTNISAGVQSHRNRDKLFNSMIT